MNQALIAKWLWRLGEEPDNLRANVIMVKYGVMRNGWDSFCPRYCYSGLWRGIASLKEAFISNIGYQVASGENILFWLDPWLGTSHTGLSIS